MVNYGSVRLLHLLARVFINTTFSCNIVDFSGKNLPCMGDKKLNSSRIHGTCKLLMTSTMSGRVNCIRLGTKRCHTPLP